MPPRSQKSSQGDSPAVDVEFREVPATPSPEPQVGSSARSPVVLRPVPVALPARAQPRRRATATAAGLCPLCGRSKVALQEVEVAFLKMRICSRCIGYGHLGAMVLRRFL